ncbi:hypothetical protein BC835DRAFT_1413312 [Cytidiella melzeri]|nr:hypothetical protein BC835DRAFT_1413312 [Cytidiella melzeri]
MPVRLSLRDARHFPSLRELPEDDELDLSFYQERGGVMRPSRHWVFLCEITQNITFMRPHYLVTDRTGTQTQVVFYLDNNVEFESTAYVTGHTLAVFYADSHRFMDGSFGLRLEDLTTVKVIPCSLQTLISADVASVDAMRACSSCGEDQQDTPLKKCSRCGTKYCSQECQRLDWRRHKTTCAALQQVRAWSERNWNRFIDYWDTF